MKRLTFYLLTFIVLTAGCFDGERGILTELIVNPAPNPESDAGYWPDSPLNDKVKAGTGSDLVISPVPLEIQDALWGNREILMDRLKAIMLLHKGGQGIDPETGELVWSKLSSGGGGLFGTFCELHVTNRKFYDKYIDAGGIAIIAPTDRTSNVGVRDEFLYIAREIILTMTSEMPELHQAMSPEHGFYYVLVGAQVNDVNMPGELSLLNWYAGFYTRSSQGGVFRHLAVGGVDSHIYLDPPQEALSSGTVVHEFAHAIDYTFDAQPHLFPDFGTRLKTAYTLAYQKALKGEGYFNDIRLHAMKNQEEYWATGAQKGFTDMHGEGLPTDELQRTWLIEGDPLLYALLDEVFPAVRLPIFIWIEE